MDRINEIWNQLENNDSILSGLYKLRFSDHSKCDAYLGIKYPGGCRMLIIRSPFNVGKNFTLQYELRGLKFEKIYDPDSSQHLLLSLILNDEQFKDVFNVLIMDVLSGLLDQSDINSVLKNYKNRLVKWQSLFEKFSHQELSPEEQRGLYGELLFLRKFLQFGSDYDRVISSWMGPEKNISDFQSGSWAIEIKTTHGNNHQKVYINSERQLDTTNLDNLFLCHISLETRQQAGETLNQLVHSIAIILNEDFTALSRFKAKLLEAGYSDKHKIFYDDIGYFIRQYVFYKVETDFPRVEEKDIRKGVGDVTYSIILSQCSDFIKKEQDLLESLGF